jgi:hypothetical protein
MMSKYSFMPRAWTASISVRKVRVAAQMRVDLGEVSDPVSVVPGRRAVLQLNRLVLEARRQPDRCRAQALDVVQLREQTRQIASVVEALLRRIKAGDQWIRTQTTGVVGGIAVGESIFHNKVERLVRHRLPQ